MFVFRPLLAFFFFSSLAAAVESSTAVSSSPARDALVVFQNVMQHSAATVQDVHRPSMMMEDRDLIEDISETCLNETVAALETFDLVAVTDISTEDLSSICTFSGNSDQTSVQCDVSKFPGVNDAIEGTCTGAGHAFVEVTFMMSLDSMQLEYNNMGFCVGSSCSTEEVGAFFDGLSEAFGEFFSLFGGDDITTGGISSVSFTLEDTPNPNPTSSPSSPSSRRMLSSFAGGAIAASVGFLFLFLA